MPEYLRIMQSPQFTFLVGPDRVPMKIHAAVVEGLSDPLYAMINNGQMKESIDQAAQIADVGPSVFAAFCEHAYTGTYTTPTLVVQSSTNETESQSATGANTTATTAPQPTPWKKQKTNESTPQRAVQIPQNRARIWNSFCSLVPTDPGVVKASVCVWPNILFHAKLNVFATRYLIRSLQEQTIASLHRDLMGWLLVDRAAPMIFHLLEFVYRNTGREDPDASLSLRKLVIHYAASAAHFLRHYDRFGQLMDTNGEIGTDMVAVLVD